jgi:crotonobetainyl-CoA:carnitine CoA-transferase CaiB-like acyl-CoA transferase
VPGEAPLRGYRIIDLSSGIAGGYCTKLLADGGAEVIKVESPAGDGLRRWSATGAAIPPDDDGALFQYLSSSKRSVVADPDSPDDVAFVRTLIAGADAVVWTAGSALADHDAFRPSALRTVAPQATIVTISPFGLDSPWADRPATDFTVQAWSGGPSYRGTTARPPLSAGGRPGEWAAGMYAAIGLLASRYRTIETGVGELVDVSMLESDVLTVMVSPVTYHDVTGYPWRKHRTVNLPDIHRASDGYVGLFPVTPQQWFDLAAMVDKPEWMEDETLIHLPNRFARRDELVGPIDAFCATRTVAEIVELASLFRVPAAPVGNGKVVTTFDHFVERNFYVENPRSGFLQPDVPYTLSEGAARREFEPAPRLGEHTAEHRAEPARRPAAPTDPPGDPARLPFAGLRVADFTAFWAGPSVSEFLAQLGADVIHVESIQRPDAFRLQSMKSVDDELWWEWCPMFVATNPNKRDLTLDMNSERGRDLARDLVAHCDIVLDNYSPRVIESWGLGYAQMKEINPAAIMVRMPAFGLSGPWRDRTGFAQTMEQVSGLAWVTGFPDDAPVVPNGWCDPIAGGHALVALLLALEHRRRTGRGLHVEVAMVGAALNVAAEQVVEYSAYGRLLERMGNRGLMAAPQGFYLTGDSDPTSVWDTWVAIAVETDEQWDGLCEVLGNPEWAADPKMATVEGRRAAHDEIDLHVAEWCAAGVSNDIVERLWAAGIPVGKVIPAHDVADLPPLVARHFYEALDHPVTGTNRHPAFPARFSTGPQTMNRRTSPLLGEHNHEILSELLGLSPEEIRALEEQRVIGTTV